MPEIIISTNSWQKKPNNLPALEIIKSIISDNDVIYGDFPKFSSYDFGDVGPDILVLSSKIGIVNISSISDKDEYDRIDETLSEFSSQLHSKLIKSKLLRKSSYALNIPILELVFCPSFKVNIPSDTDRIFCTSIESLKTQVSQLAVSDLDPQIILEARSIIEGAKALSPGGLRKTIEIADKPSKSEILFEIESEIKVIDLNQRKIAINFVPGPQRIRGLAGSGKTVILAMKAAHFHMGHPEQRILFTVYTKTLINTVKRMITQFYRHYREEDPNWKMIDILHAWGGDTQEGVYSNACKDHGLRPLKFSPHLPGSQFSDNCEQLLKNTKINPKYDLVLIDEGQDCPPSYYRLCYHLTRGDQHTKNIIFAYDELQNIFNVKRVNAIDLFGKNPDGTPLVDLEASCSFHRLESLGLANDIVLHKCYRNAREVLVMAHALGFGIYRNIVQMLEDRSHWEDVGYSIIEGDFTEQSATRIERPIENSPSTLSQRQSVNEIITTYSAESLSEECQWVINNIISNINEGLRPEDILVISLDDRNARDYFSEIQKQLAKHEINTLNLLDIPYTSTVFSRKDMATLSTVHKAKGNEAAVVYCIGIDALASTQQFRTTRNKLFTAFTRAKAWLYISGIKPRTEYFFNEINESIQRFPRLEFYYPNMDHVEQIQRDLGEKANKILKFQKEVERLKESFGMSDSDIENIIRQNK